ncbi:MAG: hypothetical protein JNK25_02090 [Phycisphaerae bacterium]|nr:hypothetical protein [Phycisphaerae bacterium]
MRANTLGIAALGVLLAAAAGCVVAIGNETTENHGARVALTPTERSSLPVVQSKSELPTIRERYSAQLLALGPSTTVEQFRALFPEAKFVQRSEQPPVDAYSVELVQKYRVGNKSYGYLARDEAWFYFQNNTLIKWGAPHSFP